QRRHGTSVVTGRPLDRLLPRGLRRLREPFGSLPGQHRWPAPPEHHVRPLDPSTQLLHHPTAHAFRLTREADARTRTGDPLITSAVDSTLQGRYRASTAISSGGVRAILGPKRRFWTPLLDATSDASPNPHLAHAHPARRGCRKGRRERLRTPR